MPRPFRKRKLRFTPSVTYFKPAGIPVRELGKIELKRDEVEAIKLSDYEGFSQAECAEKMEISQSTLYRILSSSRKKIAKAIIKGLAIKIEE